MPSKPINPTKNVSGDFDQFRDFMRKLASVPHSELKERLEAQKESKRTPRPSSSRRVSSDKD